MRRIIAIVIFIIVLIAAASFAAVNNAAVTVNYYLGTFSLPLSILMVLTLITGAILGVLALMFGTLRLRYENRRLTKKLAVSEQEINSLRILPIKDPH